MNMHKFWTIVHGGSTHFPIAMLIASLFFDLIGFFVKQGKTSRDLHVTSFYTLMLGALGSFPAVLSGLMLTHGSIMGNGKLRLHHLFVWPAFGFLISLAVWRLIVRDKASRPAFGVYLLAAFISTVFMGLAGYWGGEL